MSQWTAAAFSDGLPHDADPQRQRRERRVRVAQAVCEDGGHLLAVFGAEGGGIEMQEGAVGAHQAFPGAKPLARASFNICARRRASALATARPNGVTR